MGLSRNPLVLQWLGVFVASALQVSLAWVSAQAQPYGLDAPQPVAPFLNGAFPTRTPQAPGSADWAVVDAFPNLTLPNTLVIESNPSDDRLYVGSRSGVIVSFENQEDVSTSEPFMDLTDRVAVVSHGGFLGLAFHPEFGTPGSPNETTFYAYYSTYCPTAFDGQRYVVDFDSCNPGYLTTPNNGFFNTWLTLSRFQATFDTAAGVWRGDASSEVRLFNIRLYEDSHRGGGPVFGSDGYLYVAIGDQFHPDSAQDIVNNLQGGTVRLEVDVTDNGDGTWTCPAGSHQPIRRMQDVTGNPDEVTGQSYCIPDDNPWPGLSGGNFGEYNSIGHRNPHRIALDPVTGLLWSGEVGESTREEINVILTGRNYQWPYMEGFAPGIKPKPPVVVGIEQPPVIDFTRDETSVIIGGYVYRGSLFPELSGRYIAGDYASDRIWAITLDMNSMTATKELLTIFPSGSLGTFGQDRHGEIYMGDVFANIPLQRLERLTTPLPDPPALLSQTGAFQDTANFVVDPSAIPYDPVPFWSDGAFKQRWLFLPNDGTHDTPDEQIAFSQQGNWGFPIGTVAMKHFELPIDEANPDLRVRLETRFIVRSEDGDVYGVTYRWRPDQSDADLLEVAETGDYTIQLEGGGTRQQTWLFPSRTECIQCHTDGAGGFLALRTHQENHDFTYPSTGRTDNQLRTWNSLGMFTPPLVEAEIPTFLAGAKLDDPTASVEKRARSWLDSNCSNCHRPDTGNQAGFDTRFTTPLASQGLVWGSLIDDLGMPNAFVLHPGNPLLSGLYLRAAAAGGAAIQMPPLAKQLAQEEALEVLWDWIVRVDPGYPRTGLTYEYYELSGLTALPDFDALTPVATGITNIFDLSPRLRDDNFAFRFTGQIEIPQDGNWTFYTNSDEGSQLLIDDLLVVDNDGLHSLQEASGTIFLTAGFYPLEVRMFEREGSQALTVSWEGPGITKQLVPSGQIFIEEPSPLLNAPPVLANPGPQNGSEGDAVLLALSANDPEATPLIFAAAGLPPGLSIDAMTGEITGILDLGAAGTTTVTASASDGPDVAVVSFDWTIDGTPDTSSPTATLTAPAPGTIGGIVALDATASDDRGVVGVQFLIDGAPLGAEDTSAPYALEWDTWMEANGTYVLSAEARDLAGNTGQAMDVVVTVDNSVDLSPPTVALTAPAPGTVSGDVTVEASADDDVGVVGVQFLLDGAPLGSEDLVAPYDLVWDTTGVPNGSYLLSAEARDALGQTAQAVDVAVTVDNEPPPVAAWAFDEGGGTLAADATGHGHDGTVSGATWAGAGRFGAALEFDGVDDMVLVPDAPELDLASGMTLSAWVYPTQPLSGWKSIVQKQPNAYYLHASSFNPGPAAAAVTDNIGQRTKVFAPSKPPPDTWTHLAMTWDGADLIIYLDGLAVGSVPASGPQQITSGALRIGNNSFVGEGFTGRIDEVRIYDRALSAAEIQADLATPVAPQVPDTTDPTVSLTAPAPGAVSGVVSVQATASDDRGVVGVQFLLDGAPLGLEDLAPPYDLAWDTTVVANGVYLLSAEARDLAGNVGLATAVAVTVDNVPDTTPPTVALTAPAPGTVSGQVTIEASANDDIGVVGVQFLLDGAPLGPEDLLPPFELVWDTYGVSNGAYVLSAEARDGGGNTAQATDVPVTVENVPSLPVAAWAFDEGVGTVAADASGQGHDGTVSGAVWTVSGRHGGALEFDGADAVVLVPDAPALALGTAMTLSAWVYPTQPFSGWSAIVQKEPNAYYLHASSFSPGPAVGAVTNDLGQRTKVFAPTAPPEDAWTHLAVTYDGVELVFYTDGVAVASEPATGPIQVTSGALRIGNNQFGGEAFAGVIDDVRIYDRALDVAEIAADRDTPVTPNTAPSVSIIAPADGASFNEGDSVALSGTAADAEDGDLSAAIAWSSDLDGALGSGAVLNPVLTPGTHVLTASVTDSGGLAAQDTTSVIVNPNAPPTVAITAPGPGTVSGQVTLQASADDDLGVVGVQFLLDGAPLGPEDLVAPYSVVWDTSGFANGDYLLSAEARDAGGKTAQAAEVDVTVDNAPTPPVAAWGFDEGGGAVTADATGQGHDGAVIGAAWTAGRFGGALQFDGAADLVLVPDADPLDLDTAMTLSAWVYPTQPLTDWSAVLQKESDAYFLDAASSAGGGAAAGGTDGGVCCSVVIAPSAAAADAWTHLAVTYDGLQWILYVDGVAVASAGGNGLLEATNGALRIGNNSFGEAFAGVIDEVRIYDRAQSAAEIQTDMVTALPEPGVLAQLVAGVTAIAWLSRRRSASRHR